MITCCDNCAHSHGWMGGRYGELNDDEVGYYCDLLEHREVEPDNMPTDCPFDRWGEPVPYRDIETPQQIGCHACGIVHRPEDLVLVPLCGACLRGEGA